MDEIFYKWFNDHKEKLQKMGIQTDLISKSTQISNSNPSIFADHLTDVRMGRVTVWNSGSIDMEIVDQSSRKTVFHKSLEISGENPNIENFLEDYFQGLIRQS